MNFLLLPKWTLWLKSFSRRNSYLIYTVYHLFYFRLSANCPQCEKGNINPSAPLVIMGLCLSCPLDNSNITYQWYLYHVGDSELSREEECPKPNSRMRDSVPGSTQKPLLTLTLTNSQMPITRRFKGTTTQQPTSEEETSHTTKPTDIPISWARFSHGSICENPNLSLGPTTSPPPRNATRHPGGLGGHGSGSGGGFGPGIGRGSGSGRGTGSGTGSSSGGKKPSFGGKKTTKIPTTQAYLNVTTVAPMTDNGGDDDGSGGGDGGGDSANKLEPTYPPSSSAGGGDSANKLDPTYRPPSPKHSTSIIGLQRRRLTLREKQTTTGLKRLNFVLLGKFLQGGHSYMVSFKVFDGNKQGKASVFFNTSSTPKCGMCRVTPAVGHALETSFQLTCSDWRVSG